ncbi:RAI1-domain-containing protein [Lentinula raphanica]|uniref:Decapping nuclease n=1 Tax=Lentinula raphanica TaxID=153919 RepID=A0AA38PLR6_9AGAR|nr:RAI1 like PD-XK nuclease-domain-containing protein [Lentinula raphanica]KAJ3778105.1 RAI1-domain-containing protein [Lentinula raphanica]KAJ3830077.1 RAI1-domain-containing protein [Lentinula raphanica]KAJ3844836.1 RAI1-domain-containing protein [Lentinula raphanica]KAJ3974493.1 RAI1-domain-containing protein [Lentinula raphanica]
MPKRKISDLLSPNESTEGEPLKSKGRFDDNSSHATATEPPISENRNPSPAPFDLAYPNVAIQNTSQKSVPFQQPTPLTSFSYTPEHVQVFDDSALRYFCSPPRNAHLGYGYERWIRRPEERSRIDSLLRAVDRITDGQHKKMNLEDIGVVAWRGVFTRILTAPYEDREGWCMNVMLINGTLYLEEHRTESQLVEKNDIKPHHRKMMYYGYAFESYCTTEIKNTSHSKAAPTRYNAHPDSELGWGGDVNTNVQWCSIVRTKLGDTRLVIGGEVDCSDGEYNGTTDTFVELKTSLAIRGAADEEKFERKLLKFYFQSFLLGVPKIVVGFRTPTGQLTSTQSFQTMSIPRMMRERRHGKTSVPWDPSLCLTWGNQFLAYLKQTLIRGESDDAPDHEKSAEFSIKEQSGCDDSTISAQIWRVNFLPGEGVRLVKLDKPATDEVVNGEDRVGFIPRWYWDKLKSTAAHTSHGGIVRGTITEQPVQSAVGGWRI